MGRGVTLTRVRALVPKFVAYLRHRLDERQTLRQKPVDQQFYLRNHIQNLANIPGLAASLLAGATALVEALGAWGA